MPAEFHGAGPFARRRGGDDVLHRVVVVPGQGTDGQDHLDGDHRGQSGHKSAGHGKSVSAEPAALILSDIRCWREGEYTHG